VEFWMNTRDYGLYLGINEKKERVLLELLRPVFMMKLPKPWRAKMDQKERVYFYHQGLSTSSWKHPYEPYFRYLLDFLRRQRPHFRDPGEIARGLQDEIVEGFQLDEKTSSILQACPSLQYGYWSGPWYDPDYRMLFYTKRTDDSVCRWDDVPVSFREELLFRNEGWRILWKSFLGEEPFPVSDEDIDTRCLAAVRAVVGVGKSIPSRQERELFPTVKSYLSDLYGQANLAAATVQLTSQQEEVAKLRQAEQRAVVQKKELENNQRSLEEKIAQLAEQRKREQEAAAEALRKAEAAAYGRPAPGDEGVIEYNADGSPKAISPKSAGAKSGGVEDLQDVDAVEPAPAAVVEPLVDELDAMSSAPSAPPSEDGSPVHTPRETTQDDMHRSGLLYAERHELVPVAPACDAPGRDWDYVEWVKTSFVFPLLLELEQNVLENMMRHMVAPTPASRPGALSLFQTSHLTTPAASVPGTPRIEGGKYAEAVEEMEATGVQKLDKTASKATIKEWYKKNFEVALVSPYLEDLQTSDKLVDDIINRPYEGEGPDAFYKIQADDLVPAGEEDKSSRPLFGDKDAVDFPVVGGVARPNSPEGAKASDLFPEYLKKDAEKKAIVKMQKRSASQEPVDKKKEVIRCDEEDPRKFREARPETPNRFRIPIGPMESRGRRLAWPSQVEDGACRRPFSAEREREIPAFTEPVAPPPPDFVAKVMQDFWAFVNGYEGGPDRLFDTLDVERNGFLVAKTVPKKLKKLGFQNKGSIAVEQLDKNHNGLLVAAHFRQETVGVVSRKDLMSSVTSTSRRERFRLRLSLL
jgi:hypothetical protein